jgi:hypothetical protein
MLGERRSWPKYEVMIVFRGSPADTVYVSFFGIQMPPHISLEFGRDSVQSALRAAKIPVPTPRVVYPAAERPTRNQCPEHLSDVSGSLSQQFSRKDYCASARLAQGLQWIWVILNADLEGRPYLSSWHLCPHEVIGFHHSSALSKEVVGLRGILGVFSLSSSPLAFQPSHLFSVKITSREEISYVSGYTTAIHVCWKIPPLPAANLYTPTCRQTASTGSWDWPGSVRSSVWMAQGCMLLWHGPMMKSGNGITLVADDWSATTK